MHISVHNETNYIWLDIASSNIELTLILTVLGEQGYITYIAVHRDWSGAGIASFMMYHLIQVRRTGKKKDILTCRPTKHFEHHLTTYM